MIKSRVALPEQSYLARIGEVAYTVSSIEWTLLGDLRRLRNELPDDLTLDQLEPQTTGNIAKLVKAATKKMSAGRVKYYLIAGYRALFIAAQLRNDVLHARPATNRNLGQRLYRSEVRDGETSGKRFWIDDDWFNEAITELNRVSSAMHDLRPSFSEQEAK